MEDQKRGWLGTWTHYLRKKIFRDNFRREERAWARTLQELEELLIRIRERVCGEAAVKFEESQRAWEIFRDAAVELDLCLIGERTTKPSRARLVSLCAQIESRIIDLHWRGNRKYASRITRLRAVEEKELADIIGKIELCLDEKSRPLFESAQLAWMHYRDAQSSFRASVENSEIARIAAIAHLTKCQVEALDGMLSLLKR